MILYAWVGAAYGLALVALAYFCTVLARRSTDIAWGYWLASVVLGLQGIGALYGAFIALT